MAEIKRQREVEEKKRKVEARERAAVICKEAKPVGSHPYLSAKGVMAHELREHGDFLVLRVTDGCVVHSLQFIDADGTKRFLPGGRKKGCYHSIGKPDEVLCICEGYATGSSIHEATGHAVAVAFDAGNLLPVAEALRTKYPDLKLILCADDDTQGDCTNNPGLTKARQAARVVGALLAVPGFGDNRPEGASDFNDLHQHFGTESVRRCIEQAKTVEEDEEPENARDSQTNRLIRLAFREAKLFHDEKQTPYACVNIKGHSEVYKCDGRSFKRWLSRRQFEDEGRAAGSEAIRAAVNTIEAKAAYDGDCHELFNRVALYDRSIWYDFTDEKWRAVRMTSSGWKVINDPPILFTRHDHQKSQVEPAKDGDVWRIFDFIPITDENTQLLLLAYLISSFVPDIPHPVVVVHGPQGSGKSSVVRVIRRLIDPSITETLSFPRETNELIQKLSHHWFCPFDNVTSLQGWQSDALCRAVTGEGFSKRALYSDDEDFIYHFRRCVALNGINIAATRADLLDRSILIGLERIQPNQRRTEEELWSSFEEARPSILGGIFDGLCESMRILPEEQQATLHRMADFTKLGCAISKALGYTSETFLQAYGENIRVQNEEVVHGHPVAAAVVRLMEERPEWKGKASDLLGNLEEMATSEGIKIGARATGWPKGPQVLGRRLREIQTNLQDVGIWISFSRGKDRDISTERLSESTVDTVNIVDDVEKQQVINRQHADSILEGLNTVETPSAPNSLLHKGADGIDSDDGILPTPETEFAERAEHEARRIAELPESEQDEALEVFEKQCAEFDGLPEETKRKVLVVKS